MLLSSGSAVHDINLGQLHELLELIDSKLYEIVECISTSSDPDSDGLLDRCEYFIGIGFVAIQHHMNDSLIGMKISKKEAYSLGSQHSSGISNMWVMNAAANWWKHESEWWNNQKVSSNGENTVEIIMGISGRDEYALSNVLSSFSEEKSISFVENIIPHIELWTKEVFVSKGQ